MSGIPGFPKDCRGNNVKGDKKIKKKKERERESQQAAHRELNRNGKTPSVKEIKQRMPDLYSQETRYSQKSRCHEKEGARESWRDRSIFLSLGQWWHYWVPAWVASYRNCLSGLPEEWVETLLGKTGSWRHGIIRKSHKLPSPGPKITSLQAFHQTRNAHHCHTAFELGHLSPRFLLK